MATKLEEYFWMTRDNAKLLMVNMDPKHLQAAHTHACEKEWEYFQRQNIFNSLRDKLEEVAKKRGIELKHPDQRFPSKRWGRYFEAMRHAITDEPQQEKAKEPILSLSEKIDSL